MPTKAAAIDVRDRALRIDDPTLQRAVIGLETAANVTEFRHALRGFIDTALPSHHSATLFSTRRKRSPVHSRSTRSPRAARRKWWRARAKLTPTHAYLNDHPGIKLYNLEQMLPAAPVARRRSDFYRHVLRPEGFDKPRRPHHVGKRRAQEHPRPAAGFCPRRVHPRGDEPTARPPPDLRPQSPAASRNRRKNASAAARSSSLSTSCRRASSS